MIVCACVLFISIVSGQLAHAQGRGVGQTDAPGQQRGKNGGNSGGVGGSGNNRPSAPSQVSLPPPPATTAPTTPVPFAWLDDAELIVPGTMWIGLSASRWQGSGLREITFPVIAAAVGLTPRVQLMASVPQIARTASGDSPGLGTSFVSAKISVLQSEDRRIKVAVGPALEILSAALVPAGTGEGRTRWGLPVNAQMDRGHARFFGSGGYFSQGVWYVGGGIGASVAPRLGVYTSVSHSWSRASVDLGGIAAPSRTDFSTGASFEAASRVGIYGALGHTIATAPEHGAGLTMSGGVSFILRTSSR